MTALMSKRLTDTFSNVVSERVVGDVIDLLEPGQKAGETTSVVLYWHPTKEGRSLLDLDGLGQEIWEGIDPKHYIDELRNEWGDR